jgi:hypothetical protein
MSHTSKSILSASVAIVVLTAAGAADAHGWSRSGFGGGWARPNYGFVQRPSHGPQMGGMSGRSNYGSGGMYRPVSYGQPSGGMYRPMNYGPLGGGMYHLASNGPSAGGMHRPPSYGSQYGGMTNQAGSQPGWRLGNQYNPQGSGANGANNNRIGNNGQTQVNQPTVSSPAPAPQAPAPTQTAAQPAPSSNSGGGFWGDVTSAVQAVGSVIPVISSIAALF